jgi:hypothetical protein
VECGVAAVARCRFGHRVTATPRTSIVDKKRSDTHKKVAKSVAIIVGIARGGGAAIVYNLESERAQEQALLLDVARAHLRRPMQLTTVRAAASSACNA